MKLTNTNKLKVLSLFCAKATSRIEGLRGAQFTSKAMYSSDSRTMISVPYDSCDADSFPSSPMSAAGDSLEHTFLPLSVVADIVINSVDAAKGAKGSALKNSVALSASGGDLEACFSGVDTRTYQRPAIPETPLERVSLAIEKSLDKGFNEIDIDLSDLIKVVDAAKLLGSDVVTVCVKNPHSPMVFKSGDCMVTVMPNLRGISSS